MPVAVRFLTVLVISVTPLEAAPVIMLEWYS
jgi:hypothetical protein